MRADGSVVSRRLFRPAFHGHLDSIHLQRDTDFLNIGYDVEDGYRPPEHSVTGPTADILTTETAFQEQESALHGTVTALVASENRDKLKQFSKYNQAKIIMQTQLTTTEEMCKVPEYSQRGHQVVPHLPEGDPSLLESAIYLSYRQLNALAGSTAILKKDEQKAVQKVMKEMVPLHPASVQETLSSKRKRSNSSKSKTNTKKSKETK
jgi:hypothetical protein